MAPPRVNDPDLAQWLEDGSVTLEGAMTGIQVEQVLTILKTTPRCFELSVTCLGGQRARFDVAHGQLLSAHLGPERDPARVLSLVAGLDPTTFRLRPIPIEQLAEDSEITTDSIHDVLAHVRLLTEEPITESGWGPQTTSLPEEADDSKPTEPISRSSLPPETITEITAANAPLPELGISEPPSPPPARRPIIAPTVPERVAAPKVVDLSSTLDLPVALPVKIPIPSSLSRWERDPDLLRALLLQAISLSAVSAAFGFAIGALFTCTIVLLLLL